MTTKTNGETTAKTAALGSTREARKAGAEAGRQRKMLYKKLKSFALENEKENYSKLFIFHEKGIWWKMVGHSAVIFHCDIASRINMSSRLLTDSDYDNHSEEGVVNIRDIDALDHKLVAAKIFPLDVQKEWRVYNLGQKYTPSEIDGFIKKQEKEWENVNKTILPKEIFPDFARDIRILLDCIYNATHTLDPIVRKISSDIMLEKIADAICEYGRMANGGGLTTTDFLERVDEIMVDVIARLAIIADLRVLPAQKIISITDNVAKVKRDLTQCRPKKV